MRPPFFVTLPTDVSKILNKPGPCRGAVEDCMMVVDRGGEGVHLTAEVVDFVRDLDTAEFRRLAVGFSLDNRFFLPGVDDVKAVL